MKKIKHPSLKSFYSAYNLDIFYGFKDSFMDKKTPLYDAHIAHQAKMVPFFGWQMPLHYGSQIEEHQFTRQHASIFDVSHMTIVDVLGAKGRQFLRYLLTQDVDSLKHNGKALYSCICHEKGGIIDDLIVYLRSPDNYRVVFNAGTRERVIEWIREKGQLFGVGLQERHDLAMIALQGPKSREMLSTVVDAYTKDAILTLQPFESVEIGEHFYARTGYTGEDGFEIIVSKQEAIPFWNKLIHAGAKPAGLGARDTLRLEAGMMLYGQDMTEATSPFVSGLQWTVKLSPDDRDFIGKGALLFEKRQSTETAFVGLVLEEKGVMRTGCRVRLHDGSEGVITSGTFSPTLQKSIAFARLPNHFKETVDVLIRDAWHAALVTKTRFVRQGVSVVTPWFSQ
jgi:aminomethyltransferase